MIINNKAQAHPGKMRFSIPVWVRLVLCAVILSVVYAKLDKTQLREAWKSVTPWKLLLPLVLFWVYHLTSALRWFVLLRCVEKHVRLGRMIQIFFMSSFAGMFMPGTLGIEAARLIGVTRESVAPTRAVLSTVLERLLGIAALAVAVLTGIFCAPRYVPGPVGVSAVGVLLLIATIIMLVSSRRARTLGITLLPRRIAEFAHRPLQKVDECVDTFRSEPKAVAIAFLLSLLAQLLRIARVAATVAALGLIIPLDLLFIAVPMVTFLAMFPITIGGLGVRETGYIYFFGLAGVGAADAVVVSLLLYLLTVISVTPGGLLLLKARRSRILKDSSQCLEPAAPDVPEIPHPHMRRIQSS